MKNRSSIVKIYILKEYFTPKMKVLSICTYPHVDGESHEGFSSIKLSMEPKKLRTTEKNHKWLTARPEYSKFLEALRLKKMFISVFF